MNGEHPKPEARTPEKQCSWGCDISAGVRNPSCTVHGADSLPSKNDLAQRLREAGTGYGAGGESLWFKAADEIERLARERDHYKSEADNLRGLWNDPNHLVLLEGRENAVKGYAPKRTAPEHGECDDPEHVEAMRHLASIMDTEAERDRLHAALERITRIGPLGVDTYPECYRRMHAIAVEALSGEHSAPETKAARPTWQPSREEVETVLGMATGVKDDPSEFYLTVRAICEELLARRSAEETTAESTEFRLCQCGADYQPCGSFYGCFCQRCWLYISKKASGYGKPVPYARPAEKASEPCICRPVGAGDGDTYVPNPRCKAHK